MIRQLLNDILNPQLVSCYYEGDGNGGGGDGGSGDGGDEDVIEITDPVTNEKVQIPKKLENFVNHLISGTRGQVSKKEAGKYKEVIDSLEGKLKLKDSEHKEVLDELQKVRQEHMTAEELAQDKVQRLLGDKENQIESLTKETESWKNRFFNHKKYTDTIKAFGKTKLCNQGQVADLFLGEGKADIREVVDDKGEPTGDFETILTLEIKNKDDKLEKMTGTPEELFPKWIGQSHNKHHLASSIKPGGGSQFNDNDIDMDDEAYKNLNPTEKLKLARRNEQQTQ